MRDTKIVNYFNYKYLVYKIFTTVPISSEQKKRSCICTKIIYKYPKIFSNRKSLADNGKQFEQELS